MKYYIWTVGCQMNEADSQRLARQLQSRGLSPAAAIEQADVIVLNTCSVRQAAEDKALSKAGTLRPLKQTRPGPIVALGGCMVAEDTRPALRRRLPFVDVFFRPAEYVELLDLVDERLAGGGDGCRVMGDGDQVPGVGCQGAGGKGQEPEDEARVSPAAITQHPTPNSQHLITIAHRPSPIAVSTSPARWLSIMTGCNRRCSYCIVPFRRGREASVPLADLVAEAGRLVGEGAREITLLGQIVDRYGHDLPDRPDLGDLLRALSDLDDLARTRFLTSHPRDFADRILDAVAALPKVCEHINIPVQAGDDGILRAMRRGYTADYYREAIARIRRAIPGVSLATDVIVGFAGESEEQFQRTLDLLAEIRFDVVHVAMYSPRSGTRSADTMADDVSLETKRMRLRRVEELHEGIAGEINASLLGETVEVLVEDRDERGKWKARTRTNKLVFFADERDWLGKLPMVRIERTGPWSLSGVLG